MKNAGFSLLEILVVLMVIGVAVSMVSISVTSSGPNERLTQAVEQFALLNQHMSDMAVLSGETMGLVIEPPAWRDDPLNEGWRYRWQKLTARGWQDDSTIPAVTLPQPLTLSVLLEDQLWSWDEDPPEVILPQVAFYPGGGVTPFKLEFTHAQLPARVEHIEVDVWGQIVWVQWQQAQKEREAF